MTSSAGYEIRPAVLTRPQAAKYLAISEVTLSRILKAGEIPHTRLGQSIRFRIKDRDEYLEARTTTKWKQSKPGGPGKPKKKASKKARKRL